MKLFRAGLSDATIMELLAEHEQTGDDQVIPKAIRMARKHYQSMARLDEPTRKRRLYGLLARRGFDRDAIERILRAAMKQDTAED
jgi:SOS response regulatory protein OraA/RecX